MRQSDLNMAVMGAVRAVGDGYTELGQLEIDT
jgi:hypothetical protein